MVVHNAATSIFGGNKAVLAVRLNTACISNRVLGPRIENQL